MRTRQGIVGWVLFVAYLIWQAINLLSNLDWVGEQSGHPGLARKFLQTATNFFDSIPTWLALPLGILGIALVYLDRHLADRRTREPRNAAEPVPISIELRDAQSPIGENTPVVSLRVVNQGTRNLREVCMVQAELVLEEFWIDPSNSHSVLVKDIPDPLVLKTEGQWRDDKKRSGPFNLRIGQPKNIPVLWRSSDGKAFFRAENGERYYPSQRWVETIIAFYNDGQPTKTRLRIDVENAMGELLPLVR